MSRIDFMEILKEQYAEEIHTVYVESKRGKTVDLPEFTIKLLKLFKCAKAEGMSEQDYFDLVQAEAPQVWSQISSQFTTDRRAA
ncbi:MAG: hypothetical protein AB7P04_03885 [Bacteriovoracia bacterium]